MTTVLLKIFLTNLTKFWEAIVIALGTHRKVKHVSLHYLVKYLVFLDFRWPAARFFSHAVCTYLVIECLSGAGKFDYVGSSHQWWHVIAVVIFVWWHDSGQQLLEFRLSHPCYTWMHTSLVLRRNGIEILPAQGAGGCGWFGTVLRNSLTILELGLSNHTTVCKVEDLGCLHVHVCTITII